MRVNPGPPTLYFPCLDFMKGFKNILSVHHFIIPQVNFTTIFVISYGKEVIDTFELTVSSQLLEYVTSFSVDFMTDSFVWIACMKNKVHIVFTRVLVKGS